MAERRCPVAGIQRAFSRPNRSGPTYLPTRAVSGGAESEYVMKAPSLSVMVHADAGHITGDRATIDGSARIEISGDGTFPYVTLFLRDDLAVEKLRDVCTSLLGEAWLSLDEPIGLVPADV